MSVQSRRKPSELFAIGILCGLFWVFLLGVICFFVKGTFQEIQNQALEGTARDYKLVYSSSLLVIPAVGALCRVRRVDGSKVLYLMFQLFFLIFLVGIFRIVLPFINGGGRAFFLDNPEPGAISTYEVFFIWMLCTFGVLLLMLSVMNDKYRNEIRIGVGGILFIISIFLPNMLSSFALLRAMCTPPLPETCIKEQGQIQPIETIPLFTMAIAFSAALAVLFFFTMLSPAVACFISRHTGDGTNARESGSLSDALECAQTQQNLPGQELETAVRPSYAEPLPSAARRNNHFGNFTAAVFGGVGVWAIQAIGERATQHR